MRVVEEMPDFAWAIATAVGTIAGAVATFAAVGAALLIGAKDRKAASREASTQREVYRAQAARAHELDLLLQLQEALALYLSNPGGLGATQGRSRAATLLLALRDSSEMPALQAMFGRRGLIDAEELQGRLRRRYGGSDEKQFPH